MTPEQRRACAKILAEFAPAEVHHGDAIGADAEMHALARSAGIRVVIHPPQNSSQRAFCEADRAEPPQSYSMRNRAIVAQVDMMIGAPAAPEIEKPRSGTWRTIRYAKRLGKPALIVWPDGSRETIHVPHAG